MSDATLILIAKILCAVELVYLLVTLVAVMSEKGNPDFDGWW